MPDSKAKRQLPTFCHLSGTFRSMIDEIPVVAKQIGVESSK